MVQMDIGTAKGLENILGRSILRLARGKPLRHFALVALSDNEAAMKEPSNFSWFDADNNEMVRVIDGNVVMHNPKNRDELITLLECVAEFALLTTKTSIVIFNERTEAAAGERAAIAAWLFSMDGSMIDSYEIAGLIAKGQHHKDDKDTSGPH